MPRGVGGRGLAEIQGFEIFIHKVKIFVHTPSFRKFSTSCSTVFTCSCFHPIIVQIYILYTCCILYQYHTLQKITKNCKLKRERERKKKPWCSSISKGGGDRCAPAPTCTSRPCSHLLQLCICPHPLAFLLT